MIYCENCIYFSDRGHTCKHEPEVTNTPVRRFYSNHYCYDKNRHNDCRHYKLNWWRRLFGND